MNNILLRIDSSLRREGSYSRDLGDFFSQQWKKRNPGSKVKQRDLVENAIKPLNQQTVEGFFGHPDHADLLKLSDELISELFEADHILITAPMYNFGIPASLKSYFDQVIRIEKTYSFQNGTIGLLKNKKAYIITSMGGEIRKGENLVETHLRRILTYIGITDIQCITIDSTADTSKAKLKTGIKEKEIINLLKQ